jgi:hypothetical protein
MFACAAGDKILIFSDFSGTSGMHARTAVEKQTEHGIRAGGRKRLESKKWRSRKAALCSRSSKDV